MTLMIFFFFFLPNKHPVIMIQFNHPCNMRLRHIGGRLPGKQSLDWVTSGEICCLDSRDRHHPHTHTYVCSLTHASTHSSAQWAVSSQRALQNVPELSLLLARME